MSSLNERNWLQIEMGNPVEHLVLGRNSHVPHSNTFLRAERAPAVSEKMFLRM